MYCTHKPGQSDTNIWVSVYDIFEVVILFDIYLFSQPLLGYANLINDMNKKSVYFTQNYNFIGTYTTNRQFSTCKVRLSLIEKMEDL